LARTVNSVPFKRCAGKMEETQPMNGTVGRSGSSGGGPQQQEDHSGEREVKRSTENGHPKGGI